MPNAIFPKIKPNKLQQNPDAPDYIRNKKEPIFFGSADALLEKYMDYPDGTLFILSSDAMDGAPAIATLTLKGTSAEAGIEVLVTSPKGYSTSATLDAQGAATVGLKELGVHKILVNSVEGAEFEVTADRTSYVIS